MHRRLTGRSPAFVFDVSACRGENGDEVCVSTLTYAHELWVMTERMKSGLDMVEISFLQRVAGSSLRDRVGSPVTLEIETSQAALASDSEAFLVPPKQVFRTCVEETLGITQDTLERTPQLKRWHRSVVAGSDLTRGRMMSNMRSGKSKHKMTVVNPSTHGMVDNSHPQSVLSHLSEQRLEGLFCDVVIVVEDVKFRAHRNILAATSGFFRNAFKTAEVYTSSQVLELPDLRSEVFANILNFIYNARVESSNTEDKRSLVSAGKRLGIPFLEKLLDTEKQNSSLFQGQPPPCSRRAKSQSNLAESCTFKKETLKPEEVECCKGPRITNAFSMTEVGEMNNPFSDVDQNNAVTELFEERHSHCSSNDTTVSIDEGELGNAINEHSYAVSQVQVNDTTEVSGRGPKLPSVPTTIPSKATVTNRLGPIKKRLLQNNNITSLSKQFGATLFTNPSTSASSLPKLSSDEAPVIHSSLGLLPPLEDTPAQDGEPLCQSPQDMSNVPTFSCPLCPETFSDSVILTTHMQVHKRTLFCKICHKKFLHLKRLRNHERVCVKSLKDPSETDTTKKDSQRISISKVGDTQNSLPFSDCDVNLHLDPLLNIAHEISQEQVNVNKVASSSRTYKCSVCKRAYVTISSLKRHENVHSWQRAYPCHFCNKVFALAEYRTKHEIWHTGERRYQCIFCLETFLTYYILKNHQKSFHGIDPQLAVKKKSANGGLKSSVYPIKLYRLLPMTFRKKRYKSYSRTYSEGIEGSEESYSAPLGSDSPNDLFENPASTANPDIVSGQSLLSMPVTFMATPKMMASETPRISFDKHYDQNLGFPMSELEEPLESLKNSGFDGKSSSLFNNRFADSQAIQKNLPLGDFSTGKNNYLSDNLPFLNIPSVCSFEGLSKLSELSAAAQSIEDMASQLLQARPESITPNLPLDGKTETYIAKPACPGPSINSPVLPLCQITVKIGNEALVRRKIKGSKLFPKKRKRTDWRPESTGKTSVDEECIESPNLRLRTEVPTSVTETEAYDDPETDILWRPYYTYKPKKRGKKLKDKQARTKPIRCHTRPLSPESSEDFIETPSCPEERISADNYGFSREPRHSSQKQAFPCHSCEGSFSSQTTLSMHIISCHQPHCRICGIQCSPEDISSTAGPAAENGSDLICKSCTEDGSCFSSDVVPQSLSMEKRYRCSYCPQRFLYLATKKSHEKKHLEKSGKGLSCSYCSKICKSAMQLSMHESKHLRAEDGKEPDMTCKTSKSFPNEKEYKGQVKPDPWGNCSEAKRKVAEPTDKEIKRNYASLNKVYKKTSLPFPHAEDSSFPYLPPDIKRKKSKKKSTLETFERHRQNSLEWGQQD
ncbi:hypothetical protein DNTS_023762 [Danionella cerebrum]|uniref:Zinc finger and BTB domain-containing protein 38 n=1 Tax=Danionella cerebrum TaxID=2873325 RepID=A0A553QV69_9TELE|nr:hypothetical protein DNTS_023762 [Danionella translucida]